jgi:dTDP-glucose pyrophosphorylase
MNVVIPMAGEGSRFKEVGYDTPKPFLLLDNGLTLIENVINNITTPKDNIYLLVLQKHLEHFTFNLPSNVAIIPVKSKTEGALCTVLLARDFIDNENGLLIANSDQLVKYNKSEWQKSLEDNGGVIMSFTDDNPKWSFAEVDEDNNVIRVAEKDPISNHATAGIYYFKSGSDFVKAADEILQENIRLNNEFYLCPVYNKYIKLHNTKIFDVEMYGLGTPQDYEKNKGIDIT